MRVSIVVFAILAAAVAADPVNIQEVQDGQQRISDGTVTAIENYPYAAALLLQLRVQHNYFQKWCTGTILNQRSVLTNAQCSPSFLEPARWRIRVGSNNANSGGSVHQVNQIISHPEYSASTLNNDFAIMRVATHFVFNNNVLPATIAPPAYIVADNQVVRTIGFATDGSSGLEQLRQVQIWTINQQVCAQRYATLNRAVTPNMLCSGYLDGRDQYQSDFGSPLIHNNVVVGVGSWDIRGTPANYPGVSGRVSAAYTWISNNA